MALTLDQLRDKILTSIHGRKLGMDQDGFITGHIGTRIAVNAATSDTTATTIPGYGWTSVDTTTDDGWLLGAPVVGEFKYLHTGSTSTGIRTIKRVDSSFAIQTSANSTTTTIVAQGGAQTLVLFGVSTALYAVVGRFGGFSSASSTELAANGTT